MIHAGPCMQLYYLNKLTVCGFPNKWIKCLKARQAWGLERQELWSGAQLLSQRSHSMLYSNSRRCSVLFGPLEAPGTHTHMQAEPHT